MSPSTRPTNNTPNHHRRQEKIDWFAVLDNPPLAVAVAVVLVALFVIFSDYQTLLSFVALDKGAIPSKVVLGRENLKIAFCVTGQLQRLEILSKIANIFIPNAKMGHIVHVFVLLDDTPDVKQTFWRYDYSDTPYANYTTERLERLIARKTYAATLGGYFKAHVRVGPPAQDLFEVVDGFVPVKEKIINTDAQKVSTKNGQGVNNDMVESAEARFKNNLAWMAGLRDCVKWTQQVEQEQGYFYDLVVKLREDTLAFDNWIFFKDLLQGALTSAYIGAYRGVNDHNLVLGRKYADVLFRGIIEDYYFKESNRRQMWNNTESRIFAVASEHNVTIRTTSMCEMPLIPLRNAWNKTHWLIHPQYAKLYQTTCNQGDEDWLGCQCRYNPVWMKLFNDSVIPFDWP